jgi:hypothetical protein
MELHLQELAKLSPSEVQRQAVIFELISTEESYNKDLDIVKRVRLTLLALSPSLSSVIPGFQLRYIVTRLLTRNTTLNALATRSSWRPSESGNC